MTFRCLSLLKAALRQLPSFLRIERGKLGGKTECLPFQEALPFELKSPGGDPAAKVLDFRLLDAADEIPEVLVLDRYSSQHLIGGIVLIDPRFIYKQ